MPEPEKISFIILGVLMVLFGMAGQASGENLAPKWLERFMFWSIQALATVRSRLELSGTLTERHTVRRSASYRFLFLGVWLRQQPDAFRLHLVKLHGMFYAVAANTENTATNAGLRCSGRRNR